MGPSWVFCRQQHLSKIKTKSYLQTLQFVIGKLYLWGKNGKKIMVQILNLNTYIHEKKKWNKNRNKNKTKQKKTKQNKTTTTTTTTTTYLTLLLRTSIFQENATLSLYIHQSARFRVFFFLIFSLKYLYIFANLFCSVFLFLYLALFWFEYGQRKKKKTTQDSYQNLAYLWDKNW